jgi:predicted transcriptional regulator of viral defense system
MKNPVMTYLEQLREIALDQHGFVTFKQAVAEGIPGSQMALMSSRGRIERVVYGVYRIPQVPQTPFDLYELAVLWTGVDEACLSYETALMAWDICDINPDNIHINVSKRRRLRRKGGSNYIIHYEDLDSTRIVWWQGIPTADIPLSIEQCIFWGVPTYLLRQAIDKATSIGGLALWEQRQMLELLEERDSQ